MASSGKFVAAELGVEWAGYRFLALLCERAPLSRHQAQCLLLWCRGMGFAQMARVLELGDRSNAYKFFRRAVKRLGKAYGALWLQKRSWADEVLSCFRNHRQGRGGDHYALVRDSYYGDALTGWGPKPGAPALVLPEDLDENPEEVVMTWLLELQRLEVYVLAAKRKGQWPPFAK